MNSKFAWSFLIPILLSTAVLAADNANLQSLAEAGHWKRLRAIVEPRTRANQNDAEAIYWLSEVKLAFGDAGGALPLAERAVTLDSKNGAYHANLANVLIQAVDTASTFSKFGIAHRSTQEAQTAIQLDPGNVKARLNLMEFYWNAPGFAGGDKAKAHSLADEIARINPGEGFLAKADLAKRENPSDTAAIEQLCLKAVEAAPDSHNAHMALAAFYASSGVKKNDLAIQECRKALQLDGGRARAYVVFAQLYATQANWRHLDAILVQAEKNDPDNLNPFFTAGLNLLLQGTDFPRAESYFRKYLTQEPEGGAPKLSRAHWRLGLVLEKEGRKPEAVIEIQAAARLEPDFDPIKKDLSRLH
jgi:tetratricopeptide (TPR) repeat protein